MSKKQKKGLRRNINFRQTPKELRSERQTIAFSMVNRSTPYRMYLFSRNFFNQKISKLKNQIRKVVAKLPKGAKKLR